MEFEGSFLKRHLAGKPVVVSPNVGCFLRLQQQLVKHKDSVHIEEGKGSLNSSGIPSRLSGRITFCRYLLQTCLAPPEGRLGI